MPPRLHSPGDRHRPTSALERRPADGLDPAQVDGLLDMEPATFRSAAHEVVDLMADYLESIESYAVFPNVEPGSIAPLVPGHRSGGRRAARGDPRRLPPPRRAERDRLAAPGLLRVLRHDRVGAGDPRRDADRGARPERDALADVADRDGARVRRRRLAARGARAAGGVRRAPDRHRVDVVADRPRRRPRGGRRRRRGAGIGGRSDVPRSGSTPRRRPIPRSRRRA